MRPTESGLALAFVALGSNLDEPQRQVREALSALDAHPAITLLAASPLYRSEPMGPQDQPAYVNAVAMTGTDLSPHALLAGLQGIEAAAGRTRTGRRWGPRPLDLDLLLHGELELSDDTLTLPHPGLAQRAFVACPLADIAPGLRLPGRGSVAALAEALDTSGLERLEQPR